MDELRIQYVGIKDYLNLTVRLIVQDIKIQKHLHNLYLSGLDSSALQFDLYNSIFDIMGLKSNSNLQEIEEWYFKQVEKAFLARINYDQKALVDISAEILTELNQMKKKCIINSFGKMFYCFELCCNGFTKRKSELRK